MRLLCSNRGLIGYGTWLRIFASREWSQPCSHSKIDDLSWKISSISSLKKHNHIAALPSGMHYKLLSNAAPQDHLRDNAMAYSQSISHQRASPNSLKKDSKSTISATQLHSSTPVLLHPSTKTNPSHSSQLNNTPPLNPNSKNHLTHRSHPHKPTHQPPFKSHLPKARNSPQPPYVRPEHDIYPTMPTPPPSHLLS